MKLLLEQRQNLQAKMNFAAQLDEDYAKLAQQGEHIKNIVKRFAETLIEKFQAKTQGIIYAVDNETRKPLESVGTTKTEIQQEIKMVESSLEKVDKLLMRTINVELVQIKKSLETTELLKKLLKLRQFHVTLKVSKVLFFSPGACVMPWEFREESKPLF